MMSGLPDDNIDCTDCIWLYYTCNNILQFNCNSI